MPSIASHFVVANKVSKILNINNDDYMLGNILPDIIDDRDSHLKVKRKYYLIPDINTFLESNSYDRYIFLGYLTHLLLDLYFLEEYIPDNIPNYKEEDLFQRDKIYQDYTNINNILVRKYGLDVDYINDIIESSKFPMDTVKVQKNLDCIKSIIVGDTKYIDIDNYTRFLDDKSEVIAKTLRKWC